MPGRLKIALRLVRLVTIDGCYGVATSVRQDTSLLLMFWSAHMMSQYH